MNKRSGSPLEKLEIKVLRTEKQVVRGLLRDEITKRNIQTANITTLEKICRSLSLSNTPKGAKKTKNSLCEMVLNYVQENGLLEGGSQFDPQNTGNSNSAGSRRFIRVRLYRMAQDYRSDYIQEEEVLLAPDGGLCCQNIAFQMGLNEGRLEVIDPVHFRQVLLQDGFVSRDLLGLLEGGQGFIRAVHIN